MYGYGAAEVVGKANSEILHTPDDVALGLPRQMMRQQSDERITAAVQDLRSNPI